jgi:tetratricopeptide (TPR) repeat protein
MPAAQSKYEWKIISVLSLASLLLAFHPADAQQQDEIDATFQQLEVLRKSAKYAEAISLAEYYAKLVKNRFGENHEDYALALNNIGYFYDIQGLFRQAEPYYKRAIAITEQVLGPDDPRLATNLYNLAISYQQQRRYNEAEPLYKRALQLREKALGPNDPSFAKEINNFASLYLLQGRYREAEPLFKRALAIAEEAFGPNSQITVTIRGNLNLIARELGR